MAIMGDDQPLSKNPRTSSSGLNSARRRRPASAAPIVKGGTGRQGASSSTEPVSFTLTDAELLDCPICFDPLSSPVYQCEKGHVACASCCATAHNKCPSCSHPIGHIRCLIAEMIVEAIRVHCKNNVHGCQEKVSYANKLAHLKNCKYAPCCCPYPGCDFVGFSESLYKHFSESHSASQCFSFKSEFDLALNYSEERVFLQETNKKVVFVATQHSEPRGSLIKVVCIAPGSSGSARTYDIQLSVGEGINGWIMFAGPVECIQEWTGQLPTTAYLMVPNDLIDTNGQVRLKVFIWNRM